MPQEIKELSKVKRTGRKPKYNLTDQFDGKAHKFVQGTAEQVDKGKADYSCSTSTMRHNIYRIGKAQLPKNKIPSTVIADDGTAIEMQVIDKPAKKKSK